MYAARLAQARQALTAHSLKDISKIYSLALSLSTLNLTMTVQQLTLVVLLQSACLADAAGAHAPPLREQEVPSRGPVPVEQGRGRSSASGDSRPNEGKTLSLPDMTAIVITAATIVTVGNVPQIYGYYASQDNTDRAFLSTRLSEERHDVHRDLRRARVTEAPIPRPGLWLHARMETWMVPDCRGLNCHYRQEEP